jgi:DNA-binding transcriptional LysR family regulator
VNTRGPLHDLELDIRALRYFLAVAEELNFTRAAARLFVAQQALSRDIQQLERRIGVTLFVRTTRRVTLTSDGERLLAKARALVALHDQIIDEIAGPARPLIVDLLSSGRLTGSRILDAARSAGPDLEFRSRHSGGVGLAMKRILTSEIDVAFGRGEWAGQQGMTGIERRLVRYEPMALLLPRTHSWADLDAIPIAMLAGVEIDANPAQAEALEASDFARQFLNLTGAIATSPHLAAVGVDVSDHLMKQDLPILTSIDHVEVPGGVISPIVDPTPMYPWSMMWRGGLSPIVLSALNQAIDALAAEHGWLTIPRDFWLPEPEASRVRPARNLTNMHQGWSSDEEG